MTKLSTASSNDDILRVLHEVADAAYSVLSSNTDWGLSGKRPTQYSVDLRTDAAALEVLHGAGCAVLSEESGRTGEWNDDSIIVVMDPLDGSKWSSGILGGESIHQHRPLDGNDRRWCVPQRRADITVGLRTFV
jgi:hypothetical protein